LDQGPNLPELHSEPLKPIKNLKIPEGWKLPMSQYSSHLQLGGIIFRIGTRVNKKHAPVARPMGQGVIVYPSEPGQERSIWHPTHGGERPIRGYCLDVVTEGRAASHAFSRDHARGDQAKTELAGA
jgi:hypothetical protein